MPEWLCLARNLRMARAALEDDTGRTLEMRVSSITDECTSSTSGLEHYSLGEYGLTLCLCVSEQESMWYWLWFADSSLKRVDEIICNSV